MVVVVGSLWDLEIRSWNVETRVQLQVRLLKWEALLKEGWAHSEEPAAWQHKNHGFGVECW
jgi:hypothetical protein